MLIRLALTYLLVYLFSIALVEEEIPLPNSNNNTVTDIDGNIYRTVKIGNQIWMADNLRVTRFNDGTTIQNIQDRQLWANTEEPAMAWINNDSTNFAQEYGALYNSRVLNFNVCPKSCQIPSDEDWKVLEENIGMSEIEINSSPLQAPYRGTQSGKLKETGFKYWHSPNTGATNELGFNARGSGGRSKTGNFHAFKVGSIYWTSSAQHNKWTWERSIWYDNTGIGRYVSHPNEGKSIRCLCNPTIDSSDYSVLKEIYNSTGGNNWNNNSGWDVSSDIPPLLDTEGWHGVIFSDEGRVIHIDLSDNNLSGIIPKSIGELEYLRVLYLSNNLLSGNIPNEIGLIDILQILHLQNNNLVGSIPDELGKLNFLREINLSDNQLIGAIPENIAYIQDLESLFLANNQFSGCIPSSFSNLCDIEVFLEGNQLCEDWVTFCGNSGYNTSRMRGEVYDKWGRNVSDYGITLVDWEGYMGNPENKYSIKPPTQIGFPSKIEISVPNSPRVYFYSTWHRPDDNSIPSDNGPYMTKPIYSWNSDFKFRMGVQPDRNFESENYYLTLKFTGPLDSVITEIPINVIDQDYNRTPDFEFTLDFEQGGIFNFYKDHPEAKEIMTTILEDIAYYLDDQQADDVVANTIEQTFYSTELDSHYTVSNKKAYNGFHVFANSGGGTTGFPLVCHFMRQNGVELPIWAAGVVSSAHTHDWGFTVDENKWWYDVGIYGGDTSFYGVMKHEALHTLAYEGAYPKWQKFVENRRCINDEEILKYVGRCSKILDDEVHAWDPVLHMRQDNQGVELIDKFEMLVMQAVGWKLRETTPFKRISFSGNSLEPAEVGIEYSDQIKIEGGVPDYYFSIISGSLPAGLVLDDHTGELRGIPSQIGTYPFTVQILDNDVDNNYNPNGIVVDLEIEVVEKTTAVHEIDGKKFSIYPNPFQNVFVIDNQSDHHYTYQIFSIDGRQIKAESVALKQKKINMIGETNGMYFLNVQIKGKSWSEVLVKMN